MKDVKYYKLIRAGSKIVLIKGIDTGKNADEQYFEKIIFKNEIISKIDNRKMVLIPSGKFIFGSNSGDRDEYPEQVLPKSNFYIDKYEVSNKDYKKFLDETKSKPPLSWKNGKYNIKYSDFPVLVTFYEAERYAKWSGKRLPSEKEWEKAARGTADLNESVPNNKKVFPWGIDFSPQRANTIEFWPVNEMKKGIKKIVKVKYLILFNRNFKGRDSNLDKLWNNDKIAKNIKEEIKEKIKVMKYSIDSNKKYFYIELWLEIETGNALLNEINISLNNEYIIMVPRGLLPIYFFQGKGDSPFNVVNMSGNASEWTSSWYMPHEGNNKKNRRYGKQYKVIKGGAWFSNMKKIRVSNREIGGIPNLYRDNISGFRCIKDATFIDRNFPAE